MSPILGDFNPAVWTHPAIRALTQSEQCSAVLDALVSAFSALDIKIVRTTSVPSQDLCREVVFDIDRRIGDRAHTIWRWDPYTIELLTPTTYKLTPHLTSEYLNFDSTDANL